MNTAVDEVLTREMGYRRLGRLPALWTLGSCATEEIVICIHYDNNQLVPSCTFFMTPSYHIVGGKMTCQIVSRLITHVL